MTRNVKKCNAVCNIILSSLKYFALSSYKSIKSWCRRKKRNTKKGNDCVEKNMFINQTSTGKLSFDADRCCCVCAKNTVKQRCRVHRKNREIHTTLWQTDCVYVRVASAKLVIPPLVTVAIRRISIFSFLPHIFVH